MRATGKDNGTCLKRIAFIGNYYPRQCGIATFTTDLCETIAARYPETSCSALPVNDGENGYSYPPRVRFELAEREVASYRRAADFLNINNLDLICLQHEYGIFGGPEGSHILALLREVRMPVVTTLHTILREPDANQHKVLKEICELSDRVVVMSNRGSEFLRQIYAVPPQKIDHIPHGIPDVPFVDPNFYKDQFGVEGKIVLLTFGLLSPNKGIENVIDALPAILTRHPHLVYVVLGATHPRVKRRDGESYLLGLQRLARERGVEQHVIFHNRFVSLEELVEFIGAADIYITPYLNPAQIVSGTLAYTVGAGKAVISTPYWYAEELLKDGCGLLVPFRDAAAIGERVVELVERDADRHAMRKRAYLKGREMVWSKVAARYMESFARAREERMRYPRPAFVAKTLDKRPQELPLLRLDHLKRMTDGTGVLQHAIFSVPNYREGYTTDDNARALIVAVLLEEVGEEVAAAYEFATRYLAFLWHAFNPMIGRFRNRMSYERCWLEEIGSEDSHGRAMWALGTAIGRSGYPDLGGLAGRLFDAALPKVLDFTSPRAWAFVLVGIHGYLRRFSGDRLAQSVRQLLTDRLMELFKSRSAAGWPWFEPIVAYDNAVLPHALLLSGKALAREDVVEVGFKALDWLAQLQRSGEGHFVPIGSNGFYPRGGERARFDQQPIEAQAMVSASLEAYRVTSDLRWRREAQRAFEWFLGRNDLRLALYDSFTGGCRDGLHPDRANQNQGAESTLAFLLSYLEMRLSQNIIDPAVAA